MENVNFVNPTSEIPRVLAAVGFVAVAPHT